MPESLPASCYHGAEAFELDRRAIFAREWLFAGRASQVAGAGDVLASVVAGLPVLVVRKDDGRLKAFHNVCRHRAGPLVEDGESHRPGRLTCRYHGWVFEPVGPGRTRISYHYFWRATGEAAELAKAEAVALSRKTLDEDRAICEAVQRNLAAGVYVTGRLSPSHEHGVAAFQEVVRSAYRDHGAGVTG